MKYTGDLESPEAYIRWCWFGVISSALSRRVWYRSNPITKQPDHNSLFLNLFILLCGPPATGKGRAMKQMKSVLKNKFLEYAIKDTTLTDSLIKIAPDATTLERIYESMKDNTRTFTHRANVAGKDDIALSCAHTSCSFLIEELGVLLNRESDKVVHFLNDAFDCGDVNYETRHQGKFRLTNCCVNIIAGTYPEFIRDNPHIIVQGFSSRLIVVYEDRKRFHRLFEGINVENQHLYDELVAHVKVLATSIVGEVRLSPEALFYLREIYPTFDDHKTRINKDSRLDNYYARKNIHVQKLAAVIHFSERADSMLVERDSVERAIQELAMIEVRMSDAFRASGKNMGYEVGMQISRYLADKSEGVGYKRLLLEFTRDLEKAKFDEVIHVLMVTGQIECKNGLYQPTQLSLKQITKPL